MPAFTNAYMNWLIPKIKIETSFEATLCPQIKSETGAAK